MNRLNLIFLLLLAIGCAGQPQSSREIASSSNLTCFEITESIVKDSNPILKSIEKEAQDFIPSLGNQTLIFSSGAEVKGNFTTFKKLDNGEFYYYGTQGPTELLLNGKVLSGQGAKWHAQGFSSPLGKLKGAKKALEDMSQSELESLDIVVGREVTLEYESGVIVTGRLKNIVRKNNKNIILTFENETAEVVAPDGKLLFERSWGTYDMVVAKAIAGSKNLEKTQREFIPSVGDQTLVFSSGAEVSGNFATFRKLDNGELYYYGTQGPTQLLHDKKVLKGQGVNQHAQGFSSPVGKLKGVKKALEDMSEAELESLNIVVGRDVVLEYESGVIVTGRLKKIVRKNDKNIIFTFENETAEVTAPDKSFLFEKSWGTYDMVVAKSITGVDSSIPRVSKRAFDIYKDRLFNKEAQLTTIREVKENGIDFVLKKLEEKGFKAVKLSEFLSMQELWEKTILVKEKKGYYGIPCDMGEIGLDHGEYSHALQYYTIIKDLNSEELEEFKSIFRVMATSVDAFDQMWEKFFEARGYMPQANVPSYWRKLGDGTIK